METLAEAVEYLMENRDDRRPLVSVSAEARLNTLFDVLTGQTMIKGGRPRDFPLSPAHIAALTIHKELSARPVEAKRGRNLAVSVNAFDYIVALRLAFLVQSAHWDDSDKQYDVVIVWLLDLVGLQPLLFWAERFGMIKNEYYDQVCSGAFSKRSKRMPSSVKMMKEDAALMVFTANMFCLKFRELSGSVVQSSQSEESGHASSSTEALSEKNLANLQAQSKCLVQSELKHVFEDGGEAFSQLDRHTFSTVRTKPFRVQRLLKKCNTTALQRGASALASLASGSIRDALPEKINEELNRDALTEPMIRSCLLVDCDATTLMAIRYDVSRSLGPITVVREQRSESLQSLVKQALSRYLAEGWVIATWFPRLKDAIKAASREERLIASPLPSFGVASAERVSLLDASTFLPIEMIQKQRIPLSGYPHDAELDPDRNCTGVQGENAYEKPEHAKYRKPEWYNGRGVGFGWSAIVYSLAGRAYHTSNRHNLRKILEDRLEGRIELPNGILDAVRRFGSDDRVSYLKLDGDSIGKMFKETPICLQPNLSMSLASTVSERSLNALIGSVVDTDLQVMPVDVVYIGGDDILFAMPSRFVSKFLDDFFSVALPVSSPDITFSFAVIDFSVDELSGPKQTAQKMLLLIDSLVDCAKCVRKLGQPVAEFDVALSLQEFSLPVEQFEWTADRRHENQGVHLALHFR